MEGFRILLDRALRPGRGFRERALDVPRMRDAVLDMVILRTPLSLAGMILGYLGFADFYARLRSPDSGFWDSILQKFPDFADPSALQEGLARLPQLPGLSRALPWMVLLSPLMILSLWLHDATFDHMGLWMVGGLKNRRGFGATLTADAEALKVGALGAVLALLSDVPGTGVVMALILIPVAVYFWILRGHALAAWHGCPTWKGIVATLLNVLIACAMVLALILICLVMVVVAAQGA